MCAHMCNADFIYWNVCFSVCDCTGESVYLLESKSLCIYLASLLEILHVVPFFATGKTCQPN